MLFSSKSAAINGETILKSRPQKLASPAAVPLIGAGNASGVHPYRTALNIDWKKYSYADDNVNIISSSESPVHCIDPKAQGCLLTICCALACNTLKEKYSKLLRTIAFSPIFEASVLTVAKRNSDMPIKAEDPTIA